MNLVLISSRLAPAGGCAVIISVAEYWVHDGLLD